MSEAPPQDLYATHHVANGMVTDPWLLQFITTFLGGLPLALRDLWLLHDPEAPRTVDIKATARLVNCVAQFGTPHHVHLLQTSQFFSKGQWRPLRLSGLARAAAQHARTDLLTCMIAAQIPFGKPGLVWQDAIENHQHDDLSVLQLLQSHIPISTQEAQRLVMTKPFRPTIAGLQWLQATFQRFVIPTQFLAIAAHHGDLEVVQYLVEHGAKSNGVYVPDAFSTAYEGGHFDVLDYLIVHCIEALRDDLGAQLVLDQSPRTLALVAKHASVFKAAVRLVVENALRVGKTQRLGALYTRGLLDLHGPYSIDRAADWPGVIGLQYLRTRGLAIATTDAMDFAAEQQRWDVVQYLHTHHTEGYTTRAMDGAARAGNLQWVRFFYENCSEGCSPFVMDYAAESGSMEVLQYLHMHAGDCCSTNAMDLAASRGHLRVVQFLQENRSEGCTAAAMDGAAEHGFLDTVQYLCDHRSEGCTTEGITSAFEHGHVEVVELLFDRYPHRFGAELLDSLQWRGAHRRFVKLRNDFVDEGGRVRAGTEIELRRIIDRTLKRSALA